MSFIGRGINTVRTVGNQIINGVKTFVGSYGAIVGKIESGGTYFDIEFDKNDGTRIGAVRAMNSGYLDLSTGFTKVNAAASADANSVLTTVAITKASNGGYKLGNGIIKNWGRIQASSTTLTVTFTKPFSSATSYAVVGMCNTGKAAFSTTQTKTNFTLDASGGVGSTAFNWLAEGY